MKITKTIMIKSNKLFLIALCSSLIFSCRNTTAIFESQPAAKTNITFENRLQDRSRFNILYYLYYYNGGGVSVGDINNDGLTDIYFTANSKGGNKLYLNKGNFVFEDITQNAGVAGSSDWCTGVTMADVNSDGLLDLYVSSVSGRYDLKGHNELFINKGDNTFVEKSSEYGLNLSCFTTQTAFFDYDHDGDLDCYVLNQSHHPHANIVDTSNRNKYDSLSGDRLYRNDIKTTGKFIDVSAAANIYQSKLGYGLGLAVADMNNDGWDDIYVGNDFHENDYYYINNGDGTFAESGAKHFYHYSRFSMGNDIADYNNDGQPDIATVDMLPPGEKILKTYGSDENPDIYKSKLTLNGYQDQYSRNCLQRNNGEGASFSDVGLISGISATDWSWCPLFADFDNDGNKDLFITSGIVKRPVDLDYIRYVSNMRLKGLDKTDKYDNTVITEMPDGASHPFLFKGDGKLSFADVSEAWGTAQMKGYFNGASYADLDNDGDLDLIMNCINAPAVLLKNNSPAKNHLTINFKGTDGNTNGIGAKAYLFTKNRMQYQELMLTRGFESSSDTKLHFGLDSVTTIDSLLIVWPNQQYQVLKNIVSNKPLTINQAASHGAFRYGDFFAKKIPVFEEQIIERAWSHKENDFIDYNKQYLIPHSQSTRGPKVAVADVNGDGIDDYYVCGSGIQAGALMLQKADGSFVQSDTATFNREVYFEDVDAVFFDANGDKHPDLYVVSGGNRDDEGSPLLLDRLYLNDGKGHFTKDGNALPPLSENKSCVAVTDFDGDGDIDLFSGTLSNTKAYGLPQTSHLLINNGKGQFSVAPENIINLKGIGMVTTASFSDINNDGWSDLIVTGEWMPVKIYINKNGKFIENTIAQSTGLWQTVYPTDVNGDGYMDILAGNWGHNTKLYAGKNGPCKLYIKDFDNNGSVDQILCYTIDGKEYTFLVKDELERSLPVLKKYYLTYGEVAGKTVDFVFYDLFKNFAELKAETLSSSCFINDGKGGYTRIDLPEELQLAPVMSFTSFQNNGALTLMAAGNFYGVIPYEGRYDALQPTLFNFNSTARRFNAVSVLPGKNGEVRDTKWLTTASGKKILLVARNNQPVQLYKQATPEPVAMQKQLPNKK